MITILETLVKIDMTLPELRVLRKVLAAANGNTQVQNALDAREARVLTDIHKSIADFLDNPRASI